MCLAEEDSVMGVQLSYY